MGCAFDIHLPIHGQRVNRKLFHHMCPSGTMNDCVNAFQRRGPVRCRPKPID